MAQPMPAMMNCPLSKAQPIPDMKNCPVSKSPVVVIAREFLADYPVVLNIKREIFPNSEFIVTNVNGNILFSFNGRVLLDAYDKPLVTLQQENKFSGHMGWQVFRGDCIDPKHLLFSVRRSSVVQLMTELDVFLANKPKQHVPDFKVKGSWLEATISRVDLNDIIAVILEVTNLQPIVGCPDSCVGTVYPNVDYAFITTLMLILKLSRDLN